MRYRQAGAGGPSLSALGIGSWKAGGSWAYGLGAADDDLDVRVLGLVDRLRPLAADLGTTVGNLAIAYTLAHPGATAAKVGASSPEQVDGWLPVGDLRLPGDVLGAIRREAAAAGFDAEADRQYARVLEDISRKGGG